MTRYDDVAMDPRTGMSKHPLAGIPQSVLDAARDALEQACSPIPGEMLAINTTEVEPVAHAILMAAVKAMETAYPLVYVGGAKCQFCRRPEHSGLCQ